VQVKLFRAEKLVSGLAGEKERWEASIINLEEGTQKLPGDCLVAAAFLSYAGPFATEYRDQLVTTVWMSEVRENKVQKINPFYAPSSPSEITLSMVSKVLRNTCRKKMVGWNEIQRSQIYERFDFFYK